jgi:hypothetical protein
MIVPGYIARFEGIDRWALGMVGRDRERALHQWGWSPETIEACRKSEIQRIARAIRARRTQPRIDSAQWT